MLDNHRDVLHQQNSTIDFGGLLRLLGRDGSEHVAIAPPGAPFRQQTMPVAEAQAFVDALPAGYNVYYSVNRMRPGVSRKAADATRLTALWADLDVKSSIKKDGLPDLAPAPPLSEHQKRRLVAALGGYRA